MRSNQSSLTAISTAAMRAIEMEKPTAERICSDPLARNFIPAWYYSLMKRVSATDYAERRAGGDLSFIVARCRFMDDLLSECLDRGLQQLVILGAGFDSRAYRFGQLRDGIKVFEVDHPATQRAKVKKLRHILAPGGLPVYVTFVPIDFTHESLEARLTEGGYSDHLITLFIWEGVTPYLDAPAVDSTLAFVAQHSPAGSAIVFDYLCEQSSPQAKWDAVILLVSFLRSFFKEVRSFKIEQERIEPFLRSRGFSQVRSITGADLHARYFSGMNSWREVTTSYAIAVGVV
jgi:methyltransferase (TIGR00027 family)